MTINELGNKLRKMYETKGANKTTMIHLFGVIYSNEIRESGIKPIEIVKAAQMHESYKTEVSKGMSLAEYVVLKQEYKDVF